MQICRDDYVLEYSYHCGLEVALNWPQTALLSQVSDKPTCQYTVKELPLRSHSHVVAESTQGHLGSGYYLSV